MYEKILPSENSSWRFWLYTLDNIEFNWHYHSEYEIALTLDSTGQRYVGDHIENYSEMDLVLLGPHLPHTWCSEPSVNGKKQKVYVAQIPTHWLDELVNNTPDLEAMKALLAQSQRGIKFSSKSTMQCAKIFRRMANQEASSRFISLMQVLQLMVEDKTKVILSSNNINLKHVTDRSPDKLDKIIRYIYEHYSERLKAENLAAQVHMSTNHFHRFFKKRTEQTFTEVVNQRRVNKACSLLINTPMPISTISDLCGFNNLSNFNRRFLQFKRMTPSHFRKSFADPFKDPAKLLNSAN